MAAQPSAAGPALDPADWSYLAEGGQNLLVRYTPRSGVSQQLPLAGDASSATASTSVVWALRIRKTARDQRSAADKGEARPEQNGVGAGRNGLDKEDDSQEETGLLDSQTFQSAVTVPLLQTPHIGKIDVAASRQAQASRAGKVVVLPDLPRGTVVHPLASPINLDPELTFLADLSERIESSRPEKRRLMDGIDMKQQNIWAVEDLTAPATDAGQTRTGTAISSVLCVEIKPKWLFVHDHCEFSPDLGLSPVHAICKAANSRYRMHRVLRHGASADACAGEDALTKDAWYALYDPLDLVSDDVEDVRKAIAALFDEWMVAPEPKPDAASTASNAAEKSSGGKSKGHKKHMNNNLRIYLDAESVQHGESHKLQSFFIPEGSSTEPASGTAAREAFVELLSSHMHRSPALRRLAAVQKLFDTVDIAELGAVWQRVVGCSPFSPPANNASSQSSADVLLAEIDVEECQSIVTAVLQGSGPTTVRAILDTLEAGHKADALRLLRRAIVEKVINATLKDCSVMLRFVRRHEGGAAQEAGRTELTLRFVDLDPKSASRMRKWWALDRDVLEHFESWSK